MRSPEHLRAEVRRLHLTMRNTADPEQRRTLAEEAFYLAQQAEAIASFPNDIEGLRVRIAHYGDRLATSDDPRKQRVLAELLQEAEDKLEQISGPARLRSQHRVA